MRTLFTTFQINEEIANRFDDQMKGLPDFWMVNPKTGEVDPDHFELTMGLPRSVRRAEAKRPLPDRLLSHSLTPFVRLTCLIKEKDSSGKNRSPVLAAMRPVASWEERVFSDYARWQNQETTPKKDAYLDATPEDTLFLKELFRIRIETMCSAPSRHAVVTGILLEIKDKGDAFGDNFCRIATELMQDLDKWETLNIDEQRLLADVAFACFTVFGSKLLAIFATKAPALLNFYDSVMDYRENGRESPQPEHAETHGQTNEHPDLSLADLYKELFAIAEKANADLGNLAYAEQVERLISTHLPRIREQYSLSDEAVRRILLECIDVLEQIGKGIPLSEFNDPAFVDAFRAAWLSYFNERLQQEVLPSFLNDLTKECRDGSSDIKLRLTTCDIASETADREIAAIGERLKAATFREKSELKGLLTEAETLKVKGNKERHDTENDGYSLLLPPNVSLDTLQEGSDVALTPNCYHASATIALKEWSRDTACHEEPSSDGDDVADWADSDVDVERVEPEASVQKGPEAAAITQHPEPEPEPEPEPVENAPEASADSSEASSTEPFHEEMPVEEAQETREPTDRVDEVLNVSQYHASPEQAVQRLQHCQSTLASLPAVAADNIALLWMKQGHLPLASKTLEIAGRMTSEDLIPVPLVQAAYQGMHVWRGDTATVTRILQSMNMLSSDDIELWADRRPGGRIVPYLVFAATFQPTLFAGNMTNAPRLLAQVSGSFDGPLRRLIEELVDFTGHNNRLDVDTLREQPKTNEKAQRSTQAVRIVEWHDRIQNKQTGWAPARKAMKECLEHDDFKRVYKAITEDDASAVSDVREFADKYRDSEEQNQLMHAEILNVMNESTTAPQIEGNARAWFLRTLDEVVSIADEWVESHIQQSQRSSESNKFARRFMTMMTTAVAHVEERLTRADDLEQIAGWHTLKETLSRIMLVAEGTETPRWEGRRVTGWLAWPMEWMAATGVEEYDQQMKEICAWIVQSFNAPALAEQALSKGNFRHALLLTMHHQDSSGTSAAEKIDAIDRLFAADIRSCSQRSIRMISLLDNANIASLIDDERHYQLRSELDHLQDQLKHLQPLDDLGEIHESLNDLEADIEGKFSVKIRELKAILDDLIRQAQVERGVDWVPDTWLEQVNSALETHDTTVAEEMLEHLRGSLESGTSLAGVNEPGAELLQQFLRAETDIYKAVHGSPNPREIVRHLAGLDVEGLAFDHIPSVFKRGLEDLVGLRTRIKGLDKTVYDQLVHVLAALGLDVVTPAFSSAIERKTGFASHNKFASLRIPVKRKESGRGIVFFNSQRADEQVVNILVACGDWTVDELRAYLNDNVQAIHDRTLLLSGRPLSNDERNGLAAFCKQEKHTLYHADPVVMAMLAGLNPAESSRLKTFLQISLPWTFFNPYTGSQMQPAPPEMRYGRHQDIKSLITMRNGAAIIFGGRQLGKTTLLNETQRSFHSPEQHHHAYLHQMDGNLDRANLSGDELQKHRRSVWKNIYSDAVDAGLIPERHGLDTEGMLEALNEYFRRDNADSLMVCLDEIDPILGLDAANGFRIFRELSSLVNTSNGRFKIIIAGLENVRRFADAPNYPLHQLGSAIQVSIMSPMEALQLIREPLAYLGYEFDSPLLMNRILVETNRHPGLIHIFCHELIKNLSAHHKHRVGTVKISLNDIDQVRKDPTVHDLICDRFDITLNLDLRYKIISYSLISQSKTTFTPLRAKSIVEEWAPEIFRPMTEAQFEAFLDELCGLGVLHKMRRSEGGKEYALRNANILNLVGGPQKVEDKLLGAIQDIQENDPMSGHAFPEGVERPSPLTMRDEKVLISEERTEKTSTVVAKSSNYSVGIIAGSEALGLNPLWMIESLLAIGEEEPPVNNSAPIRYSPALKKDTDIASATEFKTYLTETVMGSQAMKRPMMLFVELTGTKDIGFMLNLLDVAHEARLNVNNKRNRVRVIFLMGPKALWQWESHPELTAGRESMQPFIALDVWKKTALAHLLNKLRMENTAKDVGTLADYSQGWYFSLDRLLDAKKNKKPEMLSVTGFGQAYSPMLQAKPKSLDEFLARAGVRAVEWVQPVLHSLSTEDRFDADDLELQLMEHGFEVDGAIALRWLSRLRLIVPLNERSGQPLYVVAKSVKVALQANAIADARV